MIIYNCKLNILWKGYSTIMILGFILTKYKKLPETTIRHETIHCRQYWECFLITLPLCFISWWFILLSLSFFYLLYGTECLISKIKNGSWKTSYKHSAFEMEAKAGEHQKDYLKTRKPFTFIKHYGII